MSESETDSEAVESFADSYLAAIRTAGGLATGVEQANAYLERRFAAAITGDTITPETEAGAELEGFELGPGGRVDSHVLGQAMEKVVTQLHGSMGAHYTPEEITSFMAEQTVHPRVLESVEVEIDEIDDIWTWIEGASTDQRKSVLSELQDLTLCDPACGSGHFLLAALDEIVRLKMALHRCLGNDIEEWRVARRTAQDNIYGVDLADEAVAMAKLRLRIAVLERLPPEMAAQYTGTKEVAVA